MDNHLLNDITNITVSYMDTETYKKLKKYISTGISK
jgi:hypothetical protein